MGLALYLELVGMEGRIELERGVAEERAQRALARQPAAGSRRQRSTGGRVVAAHLGEVRQRTVVTGLLGRRGRRTGLLVADAEVRPGGRFAAGILSDVYQCL